MDDLIYRHEAIAALGERPMSWADSDYELGSRNRFDMDRLAIDTVPSVDAVPVVRCKDCKHYQFADNRAFGFPVKRCEWTGFEDVDDEDFCSRGERKDGERA